MPDNIRLGLKDECEFWRKSFKERNSYMNNILDPTKRMACVPSVVLDVLKLSGNRKLKTIDIGSGPISVLQALEDEDRIELVRVDPLGDFYKDILKEHNIPLTPPIVMEAEKLVPGIPGGSFELVFMRNCLDHMKDPALALLNVAALLKPKGVFVLVNKFKEGTHANWAGLHEWDIYLVQERLMGKKKIGDQIDLLLNLPLVWVKEMSSVSAEWFISVYQRKD